MKKNPKLELLRKKTSPEVKRMIDHSFAVIDRIDKIMVQKGISQKDLADKLGKRESEVSKWMRGTHNFTFKTIAKLEVALEASILSHITEQSVFVMSVKNGHSITHCAVHGIKPTTKGSGSIYKAN